MAWPLKAPYDRVTTPYGIRGTSWSCDQINGRGVHTGADLSAPKGTPIYAPIAGQIRHRTYGQAFGRYQFAISPDPDEPFGAGEVFIAHGLSRLPDGTRVEIGQKISEVGDLGNVTGPHAHVEWRPRTKGQWSCAGHADPQPIFNHEGSRMPTHTASIYSNKLGYGEPSNGDASSDSVKELQVLLQVPVTGRYDDATDVAVRRWQASIGNVPDPALMSYLGPSQRVRMFATPPYTMHDAGLPAVASAVPPTKPPTDSGTTLGQYLKAQGFTVHDTDVPLGRDSTWRGVDFIMIHHTASPAANKAAADAHWIRTGTSYPPLAHLMLDRQNEVWVCCREVDGQPSPGRASHAGQGSGYGIPDGTMNERSLGIEVCNDGTQPIASDPDQYAMMIQLVQALQEFYTVPTTKVIGHKEWSSTGKVDPLDSMAKIRADVAGVTIPPPIEPPVEPPEAVDYLTEEEGDQRYAAQAHGHDGVYAAADHTHPAPPTPPTPPAIVGSRTVIWTDYSGKPTKPQTMAADSVWRMLDGIACDDPPVSGSEHHMLYARLNFRWRSGSVDMAKVECKYIREGGDETAFDERHFDFGTKSVPFQQLHFESGQAGIGGRWWMKFHGGISSVEITTRYAKSHVIAVVDG